ncbi:MAG: hypothetical protein ACOZQL_43100 [Myxococcota bacterium]
MFDVAIVGSGVLGAALAAEAHRLGLETVSIAAARRSPSFVAGEFFRLNTWSRRDDEQHPLYAAAIRTADRSRFPVAATLARAAEALVSTLPVARRQARVSAVRAAGAGVRLVTSRGLIDARAAVLCPGWGPLEAPPSVRRHAFDFSSGLLRLAGRGLPGRSIAVVGAGPSALSFLEACVGLCPRPGVGLRRGQHVTWFAEKVTPPRLPRVRRMFEARYGPLLARVPTVDFVTRVARRVEVARRTARGWSLRDARGEVHRADALVWCGGFEAPLELLSRGAVRLAPFAVGGHPVALQRVSRRGPEPIFQVGPALDQLGLASWDVGPYAEWFEKGRRLLETLA